MPEITTLKFQRENRPKIEDVIPHVVAVENQQIALDFIAWLRENKMPSSWSGVHNAWNANYKGKTICKISLAENGWGHVEEKFTWTIRPYLSNMKKYENSIIENNLQEIIQSRVTFCYKCHSGKNCIGGHDRTVLGKDFKGVCANESECFPWIYDPGVSLLEDVKKILLFEQNARSEETALPQTTLPPPVIIEPTFSPDTAQYTRMDNQKRVSGISGKTKSVTKIFDGDYSLDNEYGSRNGGDIFFQLDKPETLKMYSIMTGRNDEIPPEWTLYGYAESDEWVELDSQLKTNFASVEKHTEIVFNINNPSEHQYYKLKIKSTGWLTSGDYIRFAQIHLYI